MARSGHVHTPNTTMVAEKTVGYRARLAMAGADPIEGPVRAVVTFTMPIAKSWTKKKKADAMAGIILPTSTPDIDNLVKLVTDACNTICYKDDSQIVELFTSQMYGTKPGTRVWFGSA